MEGPSEKSSAEVQEAIALALIKNQWHTERSGELDLDEELQENDPENCVKHPRYNSNLCKYCH